MKKIFFGVLFLAMSHAFAAPSVETMSECKKELKAHVVKQYGSFTKANELAINRNCSAMPKEWLCFVRKIKNEGGNVSLADQGYIEQDCGLK